MGFPTKNDQHLGCFGGTPIFGNTHMFQFQSILKELRSLEMVSLNQISKLFWDLTTGKNGRTTNHIYRSYMTSKKGRCKPTSGDRNCGITILNVLYE